MKSTKSSLSRRSVFMVLLASVVALPSAGAFADDHRPPGQGQGPGQQHGQPPQQGQHGQPQGQSHSPQPQGKPQAQQSHRNEPAGHPEFMHDESRYVRDYYRSHKWDAPRPKHRVYVGYKLPRDYRHPLPPELRGRFHPRPGYEYYMVGDDVVLAAIATGLIVDILVNVH